MVNRLSEPEMVKVQNYIKKIFAKREAEPELKTYTKEEFSSLMSQADEDIENGKVYTLEEDREYVRKKYGF